ncbi:MAG: molybdate ABC transporter substrate-binding protein [Sterolibacteriaceae bacterium]|jgi:molybdate transport system substrate-binding protein|uniref:Molybdate ABC transporter substrate-binding protein n=1 Tax=Candidatus Methylophosphatis roskildensis TaxID=2899263 RepID=A0A9D7HLL8_9PROT|nr:molybdate ABC transporter substrate-binding protein [Candidatus Methylophosphatis roskildensis]MBK7236986.1 molybdate ABC transporter substrate-binding protein [Sterolibacteriaceae bacterium]MBK7665694.1 molybdate ABC transporter substrate-binding protein [Sterolibacteriaceae bacterium]MBK9085934.1 molybdate ABC transporter substrate-binding protein [Sterolibacteriaceae bacterium]
MLVFAVLPVRAEEVVVSAAASLTNAFKEVGTAFEKTQAEAKVTFNFAASGPLLQQIENGAPVDVFVSADQETMNAAEKKQLTIPATRRNFVSNQLVLVQPKAGSPLKGIGDLANDTVRRIAIGNPASVPVGRYTREVLQAERLWDSVQPRVINADSVRQVLDYVARGEVDAGFVYATDAAIATEKVTVVGTISTPRPVVYPIAVVSTSRRTKLAESFIAFVLAPEAQSILRKYGFAKP